MRRSFDVVPPDMRKAWLLPGIAIAAAFVGIAIAARDEPGVWFLLVPIAFAGTLIAWSLGRRAVAIEGDHLRIVAGINDATIRLDALDATLARIVDLEQEPALRPLFKTFGTSMPGFHAGHFRLRNRGRGFLLLTDRRRVLVLPERDGRTILLSLARPQALIDALAERNARTR